MISVPSLHFQENMWWFGIEEAALGVWKNKELCSKGEFWPGNRTQSDLMSGLKEVIFPSASF